MRYRLIKPDWSDSKKVEGFKKEIVGPRILEGDDFSEEFLKKKNESGYNIYYFPNYNSKKLEDNVWLNGLNVDIFNYVFVDMDLKDGIYKSTEEFVELLEKSPIKPSKIVLSGNGVHAYWKVSDLALETYLEIQKKLIAYFKTDKSVCTAMQLMRVPGFFNTKDIDNFKMVKEKIYPVDDYTVNDLRFNLPELSIEEERNIQMTLRKMAGLEELGSLEVEDGEIPEKFLKLLDTNKKLQRLFSAEKGDRSEADFAICNILYDKDFTKKEALQVMLNTNKAISKGVHGRSYASSIVNKVYLERSVHTVPNAAEKKRMGKLRPQGSPVKGPHYFDLLENGWRSREVLGLIGGTGVGKTSITLDIFYHMIKNNPQNDDVFIFFSLELGEEEIIAHWDSLTQGNEELTSRLYVVDNQDEQGNHRAINLQQIYWFIRDITKASGKKVAAIAIDHVGIINKSIDTTESPDFGIKGREDLGFGKTKTLADREVTRNIKNIAKEWDCFVIVQSQTTKEKAGEGDVPLGTNAAYGIAQFEWDMDYVMTIWQPLKRVEAKTDLRATAWQYCKIRKKGKKDRVSPMDPHVLLFDLDTKELREPAEEEFEEFSNLNREATMLRRKAEKKDALDYKNSSLNTGKLQNILRRPELREVKN